MEAQRSGPADPASATHARAAAPAATPSGPTPGSAAGEACIPNIGTRERRQRLAFGVVALVLAAAVLGWLLEAGASRWWRLALAVLVYAGATGVAQWRAKTCVALAARQSRMLDGPEEHIEDPTELARIRRQALAVRRQALVVTLLVIAASLALPA
jgi:hypothetical protein